MTLRKGRVIARIDRVAKILLLRPIPELADILVSLDRLVPEFQPVLRALIAEPADIDVTDDIVEVVKFDWSSRRVGQRNRLERRHELHPVTDIAVYCIEACIGDLAINI